MTIAHRFYPCVALATALLIGCQSSVRKASRTANTIRDIAKSSEERFGIIEREITGLNPDASRITAEAVAGAFEQRQIQTLIGGLQETLTSTQDKVSPWVNVLSLWGWIVLAGIAACALGYFGVLPLVRRVFRNTTSEHAA